MRSPPSPACRSSASHLVYDDNGISIDGKVVGWFGDDTPKRSSLTAGTCCQCGRPETAMHRGCLYRGAHGNEPPLR